MPERKILAAALGPPGALARPDWRGGGEFTAGDLCLEQKYFLQRWRRHLRLVHGWGVVCGLDVAAAGCWDLFVCPGYGIGPCGDEILVHRRFRFDLRDYLWTQPVGVTANRAWIAIEASEDPSAHESASGPECGCGCGDSRESVSRFADGFRIVVSWIAPRLPSGGGFDFCGGGTPQCLACPDTCALPLASVFLPRPNQAILSSDIFNAEAG
jgi:hypothetical protein